MQLKWDKKTYIAQHGTCGSEISHLLDFSIKVWEISSPKLRWRNGKFSDIIKTGDN